MTVASILGALALAQAAQPPAEVPNEVTFAGYDLNGWRIEAVTYVETWADDERRRFPVARNVRCQMSRDGLIVDTDRTGRSRVNIIRIWDDGRRSFGNLSIRALRIGRVNYDARGINTGHGPYRFLDVDYPSPDFAMVLTSQFSGYLAVRRRGTRTWFSTDHLLDDMFRARSLRVTYRFRPDGDEDRWSLANYTIPLDGLAAVFERCRAEIASEAALRLRPR